MSSATFLFLSVKCPFPFSQLAGHIYHKILSRKARSHQLWCPIMAKMVQNPKYSGPPFNPSPPSRSNY
ncbi:hypothetical protein Peur_028848 [Populus x canadensis]